jgi:hypothetical protein
MFLIEITAKDRNIESTKNVFSNAAGQRLPRPLKPCGTEQLFGGEVQSATDFQDILERQVPLSALDVTEITAMNTRTKRQLFL